MFVKLLMTFTWWVNRKDRTGSNVFEGGFLGLDNIGVFDRSAPLPTGGYLEQADGTAWMAFFCQNMLSHGREAGHRQPRLRGAGLQVLRALPVDRRRHGPHGRARRRDVGRRRTASSTICFACPTAPPPGLRCARWSGLLSLCASSVFPHEGHREAAQVQRAGRLVHAEPSRTHGQHRVPGACEDGRHLLALLNEAKLRLGTGPASGRGRVPQPVRGEVAVPIPS